jgi:hypothetical protein
MPHGHPTVLLGLRVVPEILARIDRVRAAHEARYGSPLARSDVARRAIELGLESLFKALDLDPR